MHASDRIQWAGNSSHGAANPAYAMYCQQRALPASVSHAVPASANAQEIRFGRCLSHGARRSRRYSKGGVMRFLSLLFALKDRRVLRGHPGRQGPRALQDRKALAERRAPPDHPDQQDRRARRGSRVLRVRKECAAKADRRDQQARRATRDRQDPRAIAAKQGHPAHPAHPAPQPQPRCAASIPTAIASPAKKTKSWSPRSARTPAVRLSSRGQRCAARDQRESSASACASRNSGPSITRLCGEACLAALASGAGSLRDVDQGFGDEVAAGNARWVSRIRRSSTP